jgi:hypothetical protein
MGRSTTRIQNLTKETTIADADVLPFGPSSGDVAKGITFQNLKSTIELTDESIVEATVPYTLLGTEDSLKLTGTGTLTMLPTADAHRSVVVHAHDGVVTVVTVGTDTIENPVIAAGSSARYTPFTGEWAAT